MEEGFKSSDNVPSDLPGPSLPHGIEVIAIQPDGVGPRDLFGFQLSGNRTMGVFVRGILGGTHTDKNGRLQVGDQILQVDDMHLTGMTTDQVARIIRMSLELHGYSKLTVVHKFGRSRGHAWRPSTPLTTSFSDSHLAHEMAFKSRSRAQSASSVHTAEIHSPGEPGKSVLNRSTHDETLLLEITEAQEEEADDDMISPTEFDTDSTNVHDDYQGALPNIPSSRVEDDRVSFRRTGKITPIQKISAPSKSRDSQVRPGKFSPKKNFRDDIDLLRPPTEGADIRLSKSNGDLKEGDSTGLSNSVNTETHQGFLSSTVHRKSFMKKDSPYTEEVPLVCFDQLSRSYTEEHGHDNLASKSRRRNAVSCRRRAATYFAVGVWRTFFDSRNYVRHAEKL